MAHIVVFLYRGLYGIKSAGGDGLGCFFGIGASIYYVAASKPDILTQMLKLHAAKEAGLISEDQYNLKKLSL